MSGSLAVNSVRLRQRLLDLGMSDRLVAQRTGLGQSAIRSMTTSGRISDSMSLSSLRRILELTGLSAQQLLDPPDDGVDRPTDPPGDDQADGESAGGDVAVLAQVLLSDLRVHPEERLATACSWTLNRLRDTLDHLDAQLRHVGLRVHSNSMGVTIRPADSRGAAHSRRLAAQRDSLDGLNHGEARMLFDIFSGRHSRTDTENAAWVRLRRLHNAGLIRVGGVEGSRASVTEDVAYAFDVPLTEENPPEESRSAKQKARRPRHRPSGR